MMTMAIAGSLAGTLGLSGGMLSLVLFFDTTLTNGQIFAWAFVAGFFGLFFGACMWETLVVPDKYEWPFSKANASFIGAFYRSVAEEGGSGALLRCFRLIRADSIAHGRRRRAGGAYSKARSARGCDCTH